MRRTLAALLILAGGAASASLFLFGSGAEEPVSLPNNPMPGRLLVGFQDDSTFRWAPDRADMLDRARDASASIIRTTVSWNQTAPRRPTDPTNPFDRAYELDDVDDLARNAQQRGIELLITIWGTPAWANGGRTPNHPPHDNGDLEDFAEALAERYSGRHAGYPAVRLFSAWNEPNLEQFLAPQFDASGRSVGPALYARLSRAVYAGVKRANPAALVAIGETSPRGRDLPSRGRVQDSHSPARFARLLSEERPEVPFDAWALHPYPPRPEVAPADPVRWPSVGLSTLERFGEALDDWFGRDGTPLWVTEYAHETRPGEPLGIDPELQARFGEEALASATRNPRVRMFVWFILRDRPTTPWQSGLIAEDGSAKPALERFGQVAGRIDARNPVVPFDADVARIPALELAYHTPAGTEIDVSVAETGEIPIRLDPDGWLEVPVDAAPGAVLDVQATDAHGHTISRTVRLGRSSTVHAD
jgi:hypothetical protein